MRVLLTLILMSLFASALFASAHAAPYADPTDNGPHVSGVMSRGPSVPYVVSGCTEQTVVLSQPTGPHTGNTLSALATTSTNLDDDLTLATKTGDWAACWSRVTGADSFSYTYTCVDTVDVVIEYSIEGSALMYGAMPDPATMQFSVGVRPGSTRQPGNAHVVVASYSSLDEVTGGVSHTFASSFSQASLIQTTSVGVMLRHDEVGGFGDSLVWTNTNNASFTVTTDVCP